MSLYESILDAAVASCSLKLQQMSNEELKNLLNDDAKIDALINDVPQTKSLITEKEMILAQNKSLAEWNLSQEPIIRQQRQNLLQLFEQASTLKANYDQLKSKYDSVQEEKSIDTTLALLQTAAAQAEEESESLAEQFLTGKTSNVEEFVTNFKSQRQLAHMRKIKAEKLREMINNSG